MFETVKQQVVELIEQPLRQEGCQMVDIVLSRYRNKWTLKVFIFSEKGTTIDECARVSAVVGAIIDGASLFESGYTLEVSSPGLDRPLKTARDFKFRVGETVVIQYADPKRGQERVEIVSASDSEVQLRDSSGIFTVGLAEIEQARIVF